VPRDGATMGEIVMRGNNVMKGYFDDPAATEQAFRGGWFHSGDLGVWHPDGYVELRDRAKDVIVSGGENISTIEVEQALVSHPAVLEVAVVGVPDDHWGERPKAFVVLKQGAKVAHDELIGHVRGVIAHYGPVSEVAGGPLENGRDDRLVIGAI
jgi:fatty-acyl-CoA synthase